MNAIVIFIYGWISITGVYPSTLRYIIDKVVLKNEFNQVDVSGTHEFSIPTSRIKLQTKKKNKMKTNGDRRCIPKTHSTILERKVYPAACVNDRKTDIISNSYATE